MKLQNNDKTLKQITSLVKEAFNKKGDLIQDPNFISRYQHSEGYGIMHNDELASYVMVNTFDSRVFTKRLKMAGIGYVSSSKESRGKGNISKLFGEIITDLHDQNIPYANLAPFSESFYRQYGFENTIYRKSYKFTHKALERLNSPNDGSVKIGTWENLIIQNATTQLYEVPMHSTDERNTMNRPYWWWKRFHTYYPGRKLAAYYGKVGLPEAYMFFEVKGTIIQVDEIFSLTGEGYRGLLEYLNKLGNDDSEYLVYAPVVTHLENFFFDQKELVIRIAPYMMSRIINFETILSSMKFINDGQFVVQVTEDKLCPWNIGCWKIDKSDKNLSVSKVNEKAKISGPIEAWTKVLLGNLTIKEAIEFGELSGDKHTKLAVEKGTISFYDYY